jgi:hypothetical protein
MRKRLAPLALDNRGLAASVARIAGRSPEIAARSGFENSRGPPRDLWAAITGTASSFFHL